MSDTLVKIRCGLCERTGLVPTTHLAIFICKDDEALNVWACYCPVCGEFETRLLSKPVFMVLNAQGVEVSYFTLAEVQERHDEVLREFSANLDITLERILRGAV